MPKRKQGHPKMLPASLDKRFMIRCSSKEVEKWEARATELGFSGASGWIRKVLKDALKAA